MKILSIAAIGTLLMMSCSDLSASSKSPSCVTVWMEALLKAVRNDEGRPTIHARNIFHSSVVLYDAWAVYDDKAETYLLGKTLNGVSSDYPDPMDYTGMNKDSARNVTMNFAIYRLLVDRFNQYGSKNRTINALDDLFEELGFNLRDYSLDYQSGSPSALGNYIAKCMINYALVDGSNEEDQHEAIHYEPINTPLKPNRPGTRIKDPNRWQPLSIREYVDKRGFEPDLQDWNINLIAINMDVFLSPEWGSVIPFSLKKDNANIYQREAGEYVVYNDPGPPPYYNAADPNDEISSEYKWGFLMVALWSSLHDPADSVKIDISPGAIGPMSMLPKEYSEYHAVYDTLNGGVKNVVPQKTNPYTKKPYEKNIVLRGDYSRVIAEYWVDGVNTNTPPGHWVQHLHDVSNHESFQRKWKGKGRSMSQLEWDVKAHLALGGALHDAAICSWGAKGWYDYVRPISAIRMMGQNGQCSDKTKPSFHEGGLPLIEGKIELVSKKDTLAGTAKEHVGKLKIMAWRGPDYVKDQLTDMAGVGWILVENWWPYQRYSSATPPFAGYTSGHSTFSIAAADVLTDITGSPYFPDGLAEFTAKKNEFLIFEEGPSQDVTLQWATFREAAEETCISRIWGGIHPPADDIKGRIAGEQVAKSAVVLAEKYFLGKVKD
jgi:hypothetical protein